MHRAFQYSALALAAALAGCETVSRDTLQEIDYGPRPTTWGKQITEALLPRMPDAKTAQITLQTQPKAYYQRETMLRDRAWGWAVCVHVWENHPNGADDPYPVVYFFRGEKLVFVNGGPGDRNPIGGGYARLQCRELGAPPLAEMSKPQREEAPAAAKKPQSPYPQ
ncbi:MAG TPA: hypothetical protein VF943_02210 [Burkholderiales bacterium]